ncbi:hypothetical protein KO561_05180 [Radiobacillus kanasensis]|uniref:hypothetical protein n=1 Tax=Radiobacillus kanasensis TaxID=2844358 RepID=UPI001E2F00B7|nr:hypothetical protein [Radiobacillus kanasensis]UFU00344.1 hypothetical protein KO561_05180 [Radiobacillus kanasensis]
MIMNDDLDHGIDNKTASNIVSDWNKFMSIEQLAKRYKRDWFEIVMCLRHMSVNVGMEIRPIGFRYPRAKGERNDKAST